MEVVVLVYFIALNCGVEVFWPNRTYYSNIPFCVKVRELLEE